MSAQGTSSDVCYRHPQRESWVLCQRCGRTICPECQIAMPAGVRCPDCVRETGGSAQWQRPGNEARPPASKARPKRTRPSSSPASGWQATLARLLRPGETTPAASWAILALVVGLWIVGFLLPAAIAPSTWLIALADRPLELWRYFTAPFGYPSSFQLVLSILLASVFFALTAPAVESTFGRQRFLVIFFAGAVLGSTATIVAGGPGAFGLTGALFALFGAYLVKIWSYPPARVQVLIMVGINLVFGIVVGGLPQIVGGLIAGVGAAWILQRADDRPRGNPRSPYLLIGAVIAGFIVVTIARALAV